MARNRKWSHRFIHPMVRMAPIRTRLNGQPVAITRPVLLARPDRSRDIRRCFDMLEAGNFTLSRIRDEQREPLQWYWTCKELEELRAPFPRHPWRLAIPWFQGKSSIPQCATRLQTLQQRNSVLNFRCCKTGGMVLLETSTFCRTLKRAYFSERKAL